MAGVPMPFAAPYEEKQTDGNPTATINDDKVTKTRGSNETGMFTQPFGTDSTLSSVLQDQVTFQVSTPKSGTTSSSPHSSPSNLFFAKAGVEPSDSPFEFIFNMLDEAYTNIGGVGKLLDGIMWTHLALLMR